MIAAPPYIQGSDLPDLALTWQDSDGNVIQYASGYTFVLKIGTPGSAATVTKNSGITGANTAPNVTIAWSTTGELNTLAPGTYYADLAATRTSDSKQRTFRFLLNVLPAIT